MENEYENQHHDKQTVSSYPESLPLPYTSPSQYPSTSGIPYPQQYPSSIGMPYPQQYPSPIGMPYPQQYPPQNPAMGYPPTYVHPPGAQQYYPPPGVVYPGQPGPNYHGQQAQQEIVIMNNQPIGAGGVFYVGANRVSMVGAIVLSCIVFWFCGWLFGGIAFIVAMVGQSSAAAGDTLGAIRLRNASYGISIAGIIIAIIVIAIVAGLFNSTRSYNNCYNSRSSYYYCK